MTSVVMAEYPRKGQWNMCGLCRRTLWKDKLALLRSPSFCVGGEASATGRGQEPTQSA